MNYEEAMFELQNGKKVSRKGFTLDILKVKDSNKEKYLSFYLWNKFVYAVFDPTCEIAIECKKIAIKSGWLLSHENLPDNSLGVYISCKEDVEADDWFIIK